MVVVASREHSQDFTRSCRTLAEISQDLTGSYSRNHMTPAGTGRAPAGVPVHGILPPKAAVSVCLMGGPAPVPRDGLLGQKICSFPSDIGALLWMLSLAKVNWHPQGGTASLWCYILYCSTALSLLAFQKQGLLVCT